MEVFFNIISTIVFIVVGGGIYCSICFFLTDYNSGAAAVILQLITLVAGIIGIVYALLGELGVTILIWVAGIVINIVISIFPILIFPILCILLTKKKTTKKKTSKKKITKTKTTDTDVLPKNIITNMSDEEKELTKAIKEVFSHVNKEILKDGRRFEAAIKDTCTDNMLKNLRNVLVSAIKSGVGKDLLDADTKNDAEKIRIVNLKQNELVTTLYIQENIARTILNALINALDWKNSVSIPVAKNTAQPIAPNKDDSPAASPNLEKDYCIGDKGPGGGIIFYKNRNRYFECSKRLGMYNWDKAKQRAKNYKGGGKNDWYLPSKEDLNKIYVNLKKSNLIPDKDMLWSSSEDNTFFGQHSAFSQDFNDGVPIGTMKFLKSGVRAIRAFNT